MSFRRTVSMSLHSYFLLIALVTPEGVNFLGPLTGTSLTSVRYKGQLFNLNALARPGRSSRTRRFQVQGTSDAANHDDCISGSSTGTPRARCILQRGELPHMRPLARMTKRSLAPGPGERQKANSSSLSFIPLGFVSLIDAPSKRDTCGTFLYTKWNTSSFLKTPAKRARYTHAHARP